MPNHVTHRVVVRGPAPDLSLFKDAFLPLRTVTDHAGEPQAERAFDFNALVPMPDIIRDSESSSAVEDGLVVLGAPKILDSFGRAQPLAEAVAEYLAMPWVKAAGVTDYEALKRLLLERAPNCVEKAQIALRAYEAHGHVSWYSWSIEGSVAKIVKLEHAWRRLDGRNDDGFQVAPFPG